jgi:imidazolonepropionase
VSRVRLDNIGRLWSRGHAVDTAAVLVDGERVAWAGPAAQAPARQDGEEVVDCGGRLVTPGLVDAHTHPVYAGHRFAEIAARSAGATYSEVAAAGGGIVATVSATRAAAPAELRAAVRARFAAWLAAGTTTVEAKTGYALTRDGELAAVRLLRELVEPASPRVSATFLPLHAVPPGWAGSADSYVDEAVTWCADAAAAGADSVDAFCDAGYFTVEQSRRLLTAGAAAGLIPRVHADELERTGGSQLAAEIGAASADHLLRIEPADVEALAGAGVVATLCPGTALAMGARPPARALLDGGVTLALGSDHNPGTSGVTGMALVVALAVAVLDLSVDEALVAATVGGARALRVDAERGAVRAGMLADLVAWDAPHEGAFAWAWGLPAYAVWLGGRRVR